MLHMSKRGIKVCQHLCEDSSDMRQCFMSSCTHVAPVMSWGMKSQSVAVETSRVEKPNH